MSVQTPFESSANNKFVKIVWKTKTPPYTEDWARVMAVDASARMMHLQPFRAGKPLPLHECPWVSMATVAYMFVSKQLPEDQLNKPETVDYDDWEKEQKAKNVPA